MKCDYNDIREMIDLKPKWFDEAGVPRYCDFHPSETNDIYAKEVAFMKIACQNCGRKFRVCLSWSMASAIGKINNKKLSEWVKDLHYGDPPNIHCCAVGPTMNSIPLQVLEFWKHEKFDWKRVPEFEIELEDEGDYH